jgi:hypothetical protein
MAKLLESVTAGKQIMCETRRRMEAADLGLGRGLRKLDQLLESTKPIAATVIHQAGKGKEARDADSTTTDFVEVPDNQTQVKALDILLSLGDYYPDKKIKAEVNHSGSIMAAVASHLSQAPEKVKNKPKERKAPVKKVVYKPTSRGKKQ